MKRLTMAAVGVVAVGLAAGAAPVAADATTVVLHRSYIHSAVRVAGVVIAPEGPSRVLTISDGTSSVMVQELVRPSIWLGVVSRPHARLRFFGGLLTGSTPPPSVVELQDRTPLGWRDMGAASVSSTGRFGTSTRLKRGSSATRSSSGRRRLRPGYGSRARARLTWR